MKKTGLVIFLLWSLFTYSQTKQEKIKEFIALSGAFNMTEGVKEQFLQQFKNKYTNVPESEWKEISKKIDANELIHQNIEIYGKHFTDKEIDELLKFYKSDLGRKLITVSPTILNEIQISSSNWAQKISNLVNDILTQKGYLSSPPPPTNNSSPPPPMKK